MSKCSVRQLSCSHDTFETVFCYANKVAGGMSFRSVLLSGLNVPKEVRLDIKNRGFDKITLAGFRLNNEFRGKGLATPFWAKAEALRINALPEQKLRLTFDIAHVIEDGCEVRTGWTLDHFALMQSLLEIEGCAIQNHWQKRICGTDAFLWEITPMQVPALISQT